LGNERGKNVPQKLELSVLNFYPVLTVMSAANSFHRISERDDLQTEISNQMSRQDLTESLNSSGPEYHWALNLEREKFLCFRRLEKHRDTHTPE